MRHSFWDGEECLAVTFADKWDVGQKIVDLESINNEGDLTWGESSPSTISPG